ncbi:MAG: T9SS type A sorting domain-containing protein [Bacteroidetes bacterium]|nr:T9SS type A sorting domain-containing protein [Bacteroidota bacterium]MBU2584061.1 T9SS type A sorting domain-containing protein [Bacteroidota bacterium]
MRKICNVNFQNSFTGVGNGGTIRVNQTQYNSPTSNFPVVEQNQISAEAVDQTINGINYTFTQWSEAGSTNRSWTFNPNEHKTYTAYFSGTPQPPTIAVTQTQNQPIRLTWTANPNSNVTYIVHRDVYHKATGWTQSWQQIATLLSGSNSYTDCEYIYGWGTNSYYLYYKVEAYYTPENTSSMSNMISTEGFQSGQLVKNSLNVPTEYGITSFPNPFNPTTTLLYKLVDDSDVLLEIYDITGKLVDKLVNEQKQSGYHSVVWNTTNINGEKLSSGIYIY